MKRFTTIATTAVLALALSGCTPSETASDSPKATSTSSSSASSAEETSTAQTTTSSATAEPQPTLPPKHPAAQPAPAGIAPAAPAPADPLAQVPADHPNGPAIEQSLKESAGKTIDHCGEPGLHETGTTFFTDGTTGWTPECASQMM